MLPCFHTHSFLWKFYTLSFSTSCCNPKAPCHFERATPTYALAQLA